MKLRIAWMVVGSLVRSADAAMRFGPARFARVLRLACLAWVLAASVAHAEPIYNRPSSFFPSILGNNPVVISWTMDDTWSNVLITLDLYSAFAGAAGQAFLTNSIGIGTTQAANEIATVALQAFTTGFLTFPTFSPISGLTLGPGTYYLIYTWGPNQNFDLAWELGDPPSFVGPGITAGPTYLYTGDFSGGYAPALPYQVVNTTPVFHISGIKGTGPGPVPEPSVTVLAASGLLALMTRRVLGTRRRR